MGWGGAGQGKLGLKSLNSPPALWFGAKISLHLHSITFAGWRKLAWGEAEKGESSGVRQNCHP